MIAFTDRQRAVLADHWIATSDLGVIAEVVAVFRRCRLCGQDVPDGHVCPEEVAA